MKNKLEKREDFTSVNFVTILHNGESDTGKIEAWERTTIINNNNYHQDHYLIMELARGYLNPTFSGWETLPSQTEDIHSEENENEDPANENKDEPKGKDPEKNENITNQTQQMKHKTRTTHIP